MIILEKDDLKRTDFVNKKEFYIKTPYKLAKKVATYHRWDLKNLNDYQAWLSKQAVKTWKVF